MVRVLAALLLATCAIAAHAQTRPGIGDFIGHYVGFPPTTEIEDGHGETEIIVTRDEIGIFITMRGEVIEDAFDAVHLRPMTKDELAAIRFAGMPFPHKLVGFVADEEELNFVFLKNPSPQEFGLMVWQGPLTEFKERSTILFNETQVQSGKLANAMRAIEQELGVGSVRRLR